MGLLSLAIWTPIAFGALLLAIGRDDNAGMVRGVALIGSVVSFPGHLAADQRLRHQDRGAAVRREGPWIDRFNVNYHLGVDGMSVWFVLLTAFITVIVVIAAWEVITERVAPVHGRVPDPVGPDGRRVLAARRPAVLRLLRSHADPDVHHHRHLGRTEPRLRGVQVLPVHAARLAADAGGAGLPVLQVGRQLRHPHLAQAAAAADGAGAAVLRLLRAFSVKVPMWPVHTWLPDATSRRPPAARWCWRPSC
jgi:NADH-quinone oxidoreductase subunit M